MRTRAECHNSEEEPSAASVTDPSSGSAALRSLYCKATSTAKDANPAHNENSIGYAVGICSGSWPALGSVFISRMTVLSRCTGGYLRVSTSTGAGSRQWSVRIRSSHTRTAAINNVIVTDPSAFPCDYNTVAPRKE